MCPKDIASFPLKKILLIGLSCLGDNLVLTPAIKLIRDTFKKAEIDIAVGPAAKEFAENHPWFARHFILEKKSLGQWLRSLQEIRHFRYDLTVDFRNSLLPFLLRTRYKMTFFWSEFHSDKVFTHESERVLQQLKPFFPLSEEIRLYFPLYPSEKEKAEKWLKSFDIKRSDILVTINPGANFSGKRWAKEKFAAVGRQLVQEFEAKILVTGGASEKALAAEICASIQSRNVINIAGKTTIRELAALLENCDLMITNDTGPMHLAVAVDCPVVSIFGPGNPYRYGPLGPRNQVIHSQISCFPCQNPAKCHHQFACMKQVEIEQVIQACRFILNEGKQLYLFDFE
ncbi:MAG: glycosyltransferase family 9 protein [Candidatus Omnitrophica bacterium]|nr:glycosyltransferase family 9 protein [Candidatus Omnitrophota bacterium]